MVIRMVIRMVSRMVIRMVSRMVILWVLEGPQYLCAVTVSSTGAKNLLQGDDNGHEAQTLETLAMPIYP